MKKNIFILTIILLTLGFNNTVSAMEWVYGRVSKVEDYGKYDGGKYQVLITLQGKVGQIVVLELLTVPNDLE